MASAALLRDHENSSFRIPSPASPYPPQPMYQFPTNGKSPVILGPNGMPHHQAYPPPAGGPPQQQQPQAPPQYGQVPQQAPLQTYDEPQSAPAYDFNPGPMQDPLKAE